jgi:hypothetical protein
MRKAIGDNSYASLSQITPRLIQQNKLMIMDLFESKISYLHAHQSHNFLQDHLF